MRLVTARQREVAIRLRMMMRFERIYTRKYRKLLSKYAVKAAKAYEMGSRRDVEIVLIGFRMELKPILYKNILQAYTTFGKRVIDDFNSNKKADGDFQRYVQNYLRDFGLDKINQIDDTTKEDIFEIIRKGESEGETISTISKQIVDLGKGIARHRAATIAITETHSAASFGSQEAAKSTGLTLQKEWAAADDSRTRPSHNKIDGKRIDMDQKFNLDGDLLMYPGDPSAPIGQIARCRCVELYREI